MCVINNDLPMTQRDEDFTVEYESSLIITADKCYLLSSSNVSASAIRAILLSQIICRYEKLRLADKNSLFCDFLLVNLCHVNQLSELHHSSFWFCIFSVLQKCCSIEWWNYESFLQGKTQK